MKKKLVVLSTLIGLSLGSIGVYAVENTGYIGPRNYEGLDYYRTCNFYDENWECPHGYERGSRMHHMENSNHHRERENNEYYGYGHHGRGSKGRHGHRNFKK